MQGRRYRLRRLWRWRLTRRKAPGLGLTAGNTEDFFPDSFDRLGPRRRSHFADSLRLLGMRRDLG
jgi:hypothetical protein